VRVCACCRSQLLMDRSQQLHAVTLMQSRVSSTVTTAGSTSAMRRSRLTGMVPGYDRSGRGLDDLPLHAA
jgi:hypothetical protein